MGRRRPIILLVAGLIALLLAVSADAQFRRGGFRGFGNLGTGDLATDNDFDGSFHFCRAWFRAHSQGDGGNWSVDYPRADLNLSLRLSELTRTNVGMKNGEPVPFLVRLTDDVLFRCPFVMMTEVGSAYLDEAEAARLKEYLLKGGFLWADDFWGSYAWDWWVSQFSKVLNPAEYPIIDLQPNHPLFSSQFQITKVPQIASINHWASTGGGTSERYEDSAVAHARAVLDKHGNIMVLMTHNTDLGDSFEREADDPQYFYQMSVPGYAFGVNALLYALTH